MRSFCSASSRLVVPSSDGVCPARSALVGAAVSARRRRTSSAKALRWRGWACTQHRGAGGCGAHAPDAHEDDERDGCEEGAHLGSRGTGCGMTGRRGAARGGEGRWGACEAGRTVKRCSSLPSSPWRPGCWIAPKIAATTWLGARARVEMGARGRTRARARVGARLGAVRRCRRCEGGGAMRVRVGGCGEEVAVGRGGR